MPVRSDKNRLNPEALMQLAPGMHCDGGGLWLQVQKGSDDPERRWIFRYASGETFIAPNGKVRRRERQLFLGTLNNIDISAARTRANELQKTLELKRKNGGVVELSEVKEDSASRGCNRLDGVDLWALCHGLHGDGNNLFLLVKVRGSHTCRSWLYQESYYDQGKKKYRQFLKGLGGLKKVSLEKARIKAGKVKFKKKTPTDIRKELDAEYDAFMWGMM